MNDHQRLRKFAVLKGKDRGVPVTYKKRRKDILYFYSQSIS